MVISLCLESVLMSHSFHLKLGIISLIIPFALCVSNVTATQQVQPPKHKTSIHNLVAITNQKRVALVIGNSNYKDKPSLRNPLNDATDMSQVLKELGFEVITVKDANKKQMDQAIAQFKSALAKGGTGLFYYAGHGVQVGGENYLIPVDAMLNSEKDVEYEAVALGKFQNAMEEARTDINIIILDACRNNPWARRWQRGNDTKGLAPVQAVTGSYVAFATAPGKYADDGEERNGRFTSHILKNIKTPNLSIEQLFKKVRQEVANETDKEQIPWDSSSLTGDFSFNPVATNPNTQSSPVVISTPKPTPSIATATPTPKPTPQSSSPSVSEPVLISKVTGVDYTPLRDALAAGQWQEADQLTTNLMLKAAKREQEGWLDLKSVENFSCSDLKTIDQLWVKYSQGKFGFSVQKQLYLSVGGKLGADNWTDDNWTENDWVNYRRFAIMVGWKTGTPNEDEGYKNYDDLSFNLSAPNGQLPVGGTMVCFDLGCMRVTWAERRGGVPLLSCPNL